jgi:hypothetical protein
MTRRRLELLCLAALSPAAFVGLDHSIAAQATPSEDFRATIAYAVDGDTLRVRETSGRLDYVRLVGIDTPEDVKPGYPSECGSRAGAAAMDRLAPKGAEVTLRYDSVADHEDPSAASSPMPSSTAASSNSPNCAAAGPTCIATTASASMACLASKQPRDQPTAKTAVSGAVVVATFSRPSPAFSADRSVESCRTRPDRASVS